MATPMPANPICCPEFDPVPWNEKTFDWDNKKFVKEKVATLFFMPLNFGQIMKKLDQKLTHASATAPDGLCLSEHKSMWKMDLYLAVDKNIADAENVTLSGKFYSKVYEGKFKDTGKWNTDFKNTLVSKQFNTDRCFMWYTTCPKCAKKYGKNYVVFIARLI